MQIPKESSEYIPYVATSSKWAFHPVIASDLGWPGYGSYLTVNSTHQTITPKLCNWGRHSVTTHN